MEYGPGPACPDLRRHADDPLHSKRPALRHHAGLPPGSGDFDAALRAAVNHGGDSDSTGAVTGNIIGAHLGLSAYRKSIPAAWEKKYVYARRPD